MQLYNNYKLHLIKIIKLLKFLCYLWDLDTKLNI